MTLPFGYREGLFSSFGTLFGCFHDKGFVNVRDHTTTGDGGLDQSIELFVTSDGELQVSWGYSLHLKILGSVTCQLKNLSSEVLKDSSSVHGGGSSDSAG